MNKGKGQLSLAIFIGFVVLFLSDSRAISADNVMMLTWANVGDDGNFIYFSKKEGENWGEPILLSDSKNPKILPTVTTNSKDDETWVVWNELYGLIGKLHFRHAKKEQWGDISFIDTETISDMAPSIAIDQKNAPWVVWSGTGKNGDDIYCSVWSENGWQKPQMVNKKDYWPDILPKIAMDSTGHMNVVWLGYNGDLYVKYSSHWTGNGWSDEQILDNTKLDESPPSAEKPTEFMPRLKTVWGKMIKDWTQASIFLRENGINYTVRPQKIKAE